MVKPMLEFGVNLECPYLDPEVMRHLVSIPFGRLNEIGGKPGLMARVFGSEVKRDDIPESFILNSTKIRLQDASEHGESGITPILLQAGLDQRRTISVFNSLFGASLDLELDSKRLSMCSPDGSC